MVFLDALGCMASITLLAALGFALARRGRITQETQRFLPNLLMRVALPPYLTATVCTHFQRDQFFHLVLGSAVPFASIILCFAICRCAATLLDIDRRRRGLVAVMASLSNTVFIGIPVNVALFGDAALPNLMLYYFANTGLQWTMGTWAICGEAQGGAARPTFGEMLKRLFSPPLMGMLLGIALVLVDLHLPAVILDTCNYLGRLTTPLALIYIGTLLAGVDWKAFRVGRDLLLGLAGRVVLSPLLILALLQVADLPVPMQKVFLVQSELPVIANITVMAAYFGADREFASIFVAVSTLTGMISVPVWMVIITGLF